MILKLSLYRPRKAYSTGFSLPELLVVIVILGITAAVGVQAFFFLVRRARVQSVALETAGWIENVRNAAADNISPLRSGGGCEIAFASGPLAAQGTLASVVGNCPVPTTVLRVPNEVQQDSVDITITPAGQNVIFTPRGVWTTASGGVAQGASAVPGAAFEILISLLPDGPDRCVRLSPALGSVEIGRPQGAAGACDPGAQWQLL